MVHQLKSIPKHSTVELLAILDESTGHASSACDHATTAAWATTFSTQPK